MNTYDIETTAGLITVKGAHFGFTPDAMTGDPCGYEVTNAGRLVAHVAPHAFISVTVTEEA